MMKPNYKNRGAENSDRRHGAPSFRIGCCLPVVPVAIMAGFLGSGLILWIL